MKTEAADLALISIAMHEKGFGLLEGILRKKLYDSDNLNAVTGDTFEDGVLKGVVTGMKIYLHILDDIRKEIKEMEDK